MVYNGRMSSIQRLYDLQQHDREIWSREAALSEVEARLADDSAIASAVRQLEQLDSAMAERAPTRRLAEAAVQDVSEKLKAVEERLYSGTITNPKELSAYDDERTFHQGVKSEAENVLLELMVEVEDLETSHSETQLLLSRLESDRDIERVDLMSRQRQLTEELDRLRGARADITPEIPGSSLAVYETLLRDRDGYAVARVERSMCQGCRLTLTTRELQHVRTSQDIVQCDSCRRILYII